MIKWNSKKRRIRGLESALGQIRDNALLVLRRQPGEEKRCLAEVVHLIDNLMERDESI